ncbi:MAG: glycosyltransferase [Desulfitobacterium hafniense]|nr:glycosyltransferase [Desulfitobacterium hafniense]
MRILHIITRSEWGGAQKVVFQLACWQKNCGHDVTVICGENGRLVTELRDKGIAVQLNPYLKRRVGITDLLAFWYLYRQVMDFDLIHAHSSKAGLFARLLKLVSGIPVCFTVHGFGISPDHPRWQQFFYHRVESFISKITDALVFVSEGNREEAKKQGWLAGTLLSEVIPNGVEIPGEYSDISRINGRNRLGISSDAYIIGNLARVAWIKNPEFWLEVASRFIAENPNCYFIWFGTGEDLEKFQSRANIVGGQRILYYGEIQDIDFALAVIDVLFLSSRSEGMPLAVLESMIRKVPVLAPDLPGLRELCSVDKSENQTGQENVEGSSGYLYNPGDLGEAILLLNKLNDPALRKRLGENGHNKCQDLYTIDKMGLRYEQVYKQILKLNVSR